MGRAAPSVLPPTSQRVERATDRAVNAAIRRQIEANVAWYSTRLDRIEQRLDELEREWDIERTLEANAATVSLIGLGLATRNRLFLVLPMLVAGFLLQHALQGWCPPVPLFRRLGFRTAREIEDERVALRQARGDFR